MKEFFDFLSQREVLTTILGYYLAGCLIEHQKHMTIRDLIMITLSVFVSISTGTIESGIALFLGYMSDIKKIREIMKNRLKK